MPPIECSFGVVFFFVKQKTTYEMRISDWSSDVCSSDLGVAHGLARLSADDPPRCTVHAHPDADLVRGARCSDATRLHGQHPAPAGHEERAFAHGGRRLSGDRKSTRLNSSH